MNKQILFMLPAFLVVPPFLIAADYEIPDANATYDIDMFTQYNGTYSFVDTFSDGLEPPSGPLSSSDYIVFGSFRSDRENGGLLELNTADGFPEEEDIELVSAVGNSSFFFNSGSAGYVSGVFEINHGYFRNSDFGVGIDNYQTPKPGGSPDESIGAGIIINADGSILAEWSHHHHGIDADYHQDIISELTGHTKITLQVHLDSENRVTVKFDYGSDGSFDLVVPNYATLGYIAGTYTGTFEVIRLPMSPAKVVYVDANAPGVDDGTNWENAYNFLQDALDDADSSVKPVEIRVAQGVYTPDSNSAVPDGTGDRGATFQLINGVTINGGFAGFYEVDPNARDVEVYETILSGDLDGNDVEVGDPCELPNEPTREENSYHVVNGSGCDQTAVLDGFVITGGNADGNDGHDYNKGGGLYNSSGSPLISNCTFTGNSSLSYGGGLFIGGCCNAVVADCKIIGNYADDGGGIFTDELDCSPLITNCIFKKNYAFDNGGGIRCDDYSTPTISNCLIVANVAFDEGGGVACKWQCSPNIHNCTITGNSAPIGGGVFCIESIVEVTNSILWNNAADNGSEIALERIAEDEPSLHPTELTISYSNVQGGPAGVFIEPNCTNCVLNWAEGNIEVDPLFALLDNDFHLKSSAGRWNPNSQTWVIDVVTSPCIDAGNPGCPLGDELKDPNNIRINMGAYGGTAEASKTPANWRSIADLTNDCVVDSNDLKVFVSYWLVTGGCVPSDFNRSQNVDFFDYAICAFNWLQESEISNHVFKISIEMGWSYQNPDDSNDTEYGFDEFWMSTDGLVERIEFLAPSGNTFEIPQISYQEIEIPGGIIETEWWYDYESGAYEWKYQTIFDEPDGLAEFGDGQYIITVYYDNGSQDQTTVWFGIPDTNDFLPQPIQEPVFTSFSHGDVLTSPVTIEWEPFTDPAADVIWVALDNKDNYEEYDFLFDASETGFDQPLVLSEGLWEAELAFGVWYNTQNNDGIDIRVRKYSESDYEFTVVP